MKIFPEPVQPCREGRRSNAALAAGLLEIELPRRLIGSHMGRKNRSRFSSNLFSNVCGRRSVGGALFAVTALWFAAPAFAQFAPAGQSQSTQAAQLPLSGRTAQTSGSVKTSEAPAPSTTATVNTLSPSVQVQGAYAGSTPGVANVPFNGKLGLREAIQRGLAYNLGQSGATQSA